MFTRSRTRYRPRGFALGGPSIINVDSLGIEVAEAVKSSFPEIFIINVDSLGVEVAEAVNGAY